MAKFGRGEILPNTMAGANKMVREESLQFTADGKFIYSELKGYKGVEGSMKEQGRLTGRYKMKNKHKTVELVYDKEKKKSDQRKNDRMEEKKVKYKKWFIPGDGTLQCYADQSVRFK